MRKSLLLTIAAALTAALSMTSCSNEVEELAIPAAKKQLSVTLTLPGNAGTRVVFEEDKTGDVFNGLKTKWEIGDEVSVILSGNYTNIATFTQSGALENDGKSTTFTGEPHAGWGEIADGTHFSFVYPKFLTGDYLRDFTKQDGTLANLSKFDDLDMDATYSGGKFTYNNTYDRFASFLRLPQGLALCDDSFSGTVTLEIFGNEVASKMDKTAKPVTATGENAILVSPVTVSGGKLSSDVYIAFEKSSMNNITKMNLSVVPESGKGNKLYQICYDAGFKEGEMYTITSVEKMTNVQIGWVIAQNGKFYKNATLASEAGTTAEAMVAYLDNAVGDAPHGLAIALQDASTSVAWTSAATTVETWGNSHPVEGGTWRLPSPDDFKYMFQGCGGDPYTSELEFEMKFDFGNFFDFYTKAGGKANLTNSYWTDKSSGSNAWYCEFVGETLFDGFFDIQAQSNAAYACGVLEF